MAVMTYAEFLATEAYLSQHPGAGVRVVVYRADETEPLIGRSTGVSHRDDFEQLPVEEAGNDGVDEIVTGRHTGSGSLSLFFTPERNDKLPTRGTFLGTGNGIEYTILVMTGKGRVGTDEATGEGVVLEAYVGVKLNNYNKQVGARGLIGGDLAFLYENRMNGEEWAAYAGS